MSDNNRGQNLSDQYNNPVNTNSSLGDTEDEQQNLSSANSSSDLSEDQDGPVTQSSADQDVEGSKNHAATSSADKNRNIATSYHDNMRQTSTRANEASDRLDSGSGGLSSGGVKSATQP